MWQGGGRDRSDCSKSKKLRGVDKHFDGKIECRLTFCRRMIGASYARHGVISMKFDEMIEFFFGRH